MNATNQTTLHRVAPRPTKLKRAIVAATIISLNLTSLTPAWALTLAQKPLVASVGSLPPPNIMLTVDTSGSMNFRHMPESSTTVNGYTVSVDTAAIWRVHPDDNYQIVPSAYDKGAMPGSKAASSSNDSLDQIKLRSADINTVYYNPEILYKPWPKSDGTRYPDAVYTGAFVDPLAQTTTSAKIDLSQTSISTETCDWVWVGSSRRGSWQWVCSTSSTPFFPTLYYKLKSTSVDPNSPSSYNRYDPSTDTSFPKYTARTDCTGTTCTQAQERQNFANWFVYYRSRMLMTKAALSEAFYNMGETARVGWTTLKYANGHRSTSTNKQSPILQGVRLLTSTHRATLINTIQTGTDFYAEGGTPLRIALDESGRYFTDTSNTGPWSDDPANSSSSKSTCRRAYNILTTDGYYNESDSDIGTDKVVGDFDGTSAGNYTAKSPYKDKSSGTGFSNTLADFALKYWATDLASGIDNNVIATSKDPATWQHLVQFTLGMGVSGSLNPKSDLDKLTKGTLNWPDPSLSDTYKIDDMWHAAVNSRGEFYSVKAYTELASAVKNAVGMAVAQNLRESGVATVSSSLINDNRKFVPEYQSGIWTGEMYAYSINSAGDVGSTPLWKGSTVLPSFSARNFLILNADTGSTVSFDWSTMGATNQSAMTSGSANLVNFIKGDTSNEGSTTSTYRQRSGVLPDFINSTPVYAKGAVDMSYEKLGTTEASSYRTFVTNKSARNVPLVMIGSNGGYVSGFNPDTGVESFAYVPRGVLPNLYKLAAQDYGISSGSNEHQYYVDGPLTEADAYYGSSWKNLLIGSLGAGGKGLFALKLPVSSSDGTNPAVLWDLTTTSHASVGNITSAVEVGMLPNGEWKVFVGNGYNSSNGTAALLVIDVATGAISAVGTDSRTDNGLGGIKVVRNDAQQVVAIYGGDLFGRVWRFEYNSTSQNMVVGYGGSPLFTATDSSGNAQPITAAPTVGYDAAGRTMVLFGTGKLLETADKTSTSTQTFYGILDKISATASTASRTPDFNDSNTSTLDRSFLVGQTISNGSTTGLLNVSANAQTSTSLGWYMDLVIPTNIKARVTYPPQMIGDFVYINTIVPAGTAAACESAGGKGYNFLLPATTGAQYTLPVYDTNGDGVINSSDSTSAGMGVNADGGDRILKGSSTSTTANGTTVTSTDISIQSSNNAFKGKIYCLINCGGTGLTVTDRIWKRIQGPTN